ncbi:uncharacterized protein LOC120108614 [Phoenix dactylifera]|uniref:Uncharacterized protein LOC103724306 n=1 Tax=Phoenix dactylifera TaxID=42345 RepID=A0A8B8IZ36_PHODC|nr:uncharacterized protein LOC103724306 [Phoenix dactylifera]XP_026656280.2 uncharacterized protein LOC103724306 [Phoenix dactylifera]XP_026656281.2 uncharacterized protein LOC103724306 [Phoenix dactylifera]XP_026656282.2 uncharacterized protein LOC103724306 [Phoenix dactylifera]XP_038978200.1 uncharacterized protein LOC120108614 [Phoenix dactylifera]XP_038978201.1 uncharacterized protein LOC120108614 [Phoenix dactylifera]
MDRESKKRGREEPVVVVMVAPEKEMGIVGGTAVEAEIRRKEGKMQEISESSSSDVTFEVGDIFEISDVYRPPGLFEFPWHKEEDGGLIAAAAAAAEEEESDGRDLRDVFFSSLVDGCSAAIGFPGDRLSPPLGPIAFPVDGEEGSWPSDGDADSVDCIWSTVLHQPLTTVYRKRSSA